ncbi:hypothetical protein OS493_035211 [Desmophyllum pertusum]|uniref:Uncharacterized protein n=1 Tax=Desmophyllum pertusum TaxID=174260 RepID=A0A9X0D706_9CNID|nr:hypothetical protein OS493_035211 [Desmophyllum pertusum]
MPTRGTPPYSVIQDIMYPSGEGTVGEKTRVSTRGHEPAVTITNVMYYVRDEGKTDSEPSRQLEFEDVWLASQVEPLQDNFDVLDKKPLSNLLQGALGSFSVFTRR